MTDDGPLSGIKVLDVASFMAAPISAMFLADFGADVVKVEHPTGDSVRSWGNVRDGVPLMWKMIGRNKRSIAIDFHKPDGQELLKDLAREADVIVENFRPGKMASWGLGYEDLSKINPRLVMLSISAYGQTGCNSSRPGFGTLAEAISGYAHLTGQPDGPPTLPSFGLADGISGLCGAFAVMVALHERDSRSGRGQQIDLALYEPIMVMLGHVFIEYDQLGIEAHRLGSRLPFAAPRNVYRTKDDKWVAMSCSAQSTFERACRAIGREDLLTDPRFSDNRVRMANAAEVDEIFVEWISKNVADFVLDRLGEAGAAIAPVYGLPEIFRDQHFKERENIATVVDEQLGEIRMQNVMPRLVRTPGRIRHAGPRLGEHTSEVLKEWLGR